MSKIKEAIETLERAINSNSWGVCGTLADHALVLLRAEMTCKKCGGSGFDPERSTCAEQWMPDVPCPDCQDKEPASELEKYHILKNQVIDMSLAIIGWQEGLSFENEKELIDELERMINEAIK